LLLGLDSSGSHPPAPILDYGRHNVVTVVGQSKREASDPAAVKQAAVTLGYAISSVNIAVTEPVLQLCRA
jgi:hypothetical protein